MILSPNMFPDRNHLFHIGGQGVDLFHVCILLLLNSERRAGVRGAVQNVAFNLFTPNQRKMTQTDEIPPLNSEADVKNGFNEDLLHFLLP